MSKNILYISTIVPRNGIGSWIIALRHLKGLEKSGYRITIVIPVSKKQLLEDYKSWNVIILPDRLWWWPPCNIYNRFSLFIRFFLWYNYVFSKIDKDSFCSILTIIPDNIAIFAAYSSKKTGIPLSVIVHDEWELNAKNKQELDFIKKYKNYIFQNCGMVWTVSDTMTEKYKYLVSGDINTLYPVPAGTNNFVQWNESFKKQPVLAFAGGFEKEHLDCFIKISELLKEVNGKLLIVENELNDKDSFSKLVNSCENIILQKQFEKNTEVLDFLYHNATAFIVSFIGQYKWSELSFPSKFIEFSHIGLPMLLISPSDTPLGNFAKKNSWFSYFEDVSDERLKEFFHDLTDKTRWNAMAEQTRKVAMSEFNSDRIQNQFEKELAKNQ